MHCPNSKFSLDSRNSNIVRIVDDALSLLQREECQSQAVSQSFFIVMDGLVRGELSEILVMVMVVIVMVIMVMVMVVMVIVMVFKVMVMVVMVMVVMVMVMVVMVMVVMVIVMVVMVIGGGICGGICVRTALRICH
jgi:hypothetical protein